MVRAVVAGIGGRMGSRIGQLVHETEGFELSGAFEAPGHSAVGEDIAAAIGGLPTGRRVGAGLAEVVAGADVVIDFTTAAASLKHLEVAAERRVPMVIGSTGFSPSQIQEAQAFTRMIPCVLTPNMSVGVNVLFKVVAEVARMLGTGFDVEILEAHHRFKKDAPSGTALKLAQIIAQVLDRDLDQTGVFARHGLIGERSDREIGVQTLRGGDIVGEHTVMFAGLGERIELIHRAHSRDNFAHGALRAARWVVQQPPGLYDMQHVLGIK